MSSNMKKRFVDVTYRILTEEGPEAVKIRRLARECGCTSTVIYRHFDNLSHLVALASIRIPNEYIRDFRNLTQDQELAADPYRLNLRMWDCLAEHAFRSMRNMKIYEELFYGQYRNSLGDLIYEYYQLFFETENFEFDGYATRILFNDDMVQRDLVLLRRAAALGILSPGDAEILSRTESLVFHGLLLKYMNHEESGVPETARKEFREILENFAGHYRKK